MQKRMRKGDNVILIKHGVNFMNGRLWTAEAGLKIGLIYQVEDSSQGLFKTDYIWINGYMLKAKYFQKTQI